MPPAGRLWALRRFCRLQRHSKWSPECHYPGFALLLSLRLPPPGCKYKHHVPVRFPKHSRGCDFSWFSQQPCAGNRVEILCPLDRWGNRKSDTFNGSVGTSFSTTAQNPPPSSFQHNEISYTSGIHWRLISAVPFMCRNLQTIKPWPCSVGDVAAPFSQRLSEICYLPLPMLELRFSAYTSLTRAKGLSPGTGLLVKVVTSRRSGEVVLSLEQRSWGSQMPGFLPPT